MSLNETELTFEDAFGHSGTYECIDPPEKVCVILSKRFLICEALMFLSWVEFCGIILQCVILFVFN